MTREELKPYIDGISDNTEIIMIKSQAEADAIPKSTATVRLNDRVLKYRKHAENIIKVWVILLTLFPSWVPNAEHVTKFTGDTAKALLAKCDLSFPHSENDQKYPLIELNWIAGSTTTVPPSAYSYDQLSSSGIQPISIRIG